MSKVVNNIGAMPGSIYRIALENFMTFKQIELFPGQSLNMIIGPNGAGKSSIVCAIILGLCGKTSIIGRAKKITEYVRSNCENAFIEIELYRHQGERNVIITRSFNLEGASTWSIDHKNAREKQVQDIISSLNIQVDNLCQLLPQDRVQDFSKMDPQELLRSTLAAVGGQTSVDQLEELVASKVEQRGLTTRLANSGEMLAEQIRLNERLKVIIDAMEHRKEIERELEVIEKKKLWLQYQELRDKVKEYTVDRGEAVKLVNAHKSRADPLEKMVEKAKNSIGKLEQQKLATSRELHNIKDKIKSSVDSVKQQEYRIKDIWTSFEHKLEQHSNRQREIDEAKVILDKLCHDKVMLVEKIGDEEKVKMEMKEVQQTIQKTNAAIDQLKKQKMEVQYDLEQNVEPQISAYNNKIRSLEDVGAKKLQVLRDCSEDCYQAVLWLRENTDRFNHPVYEPMVLEINFTDPKYAQYLENTVNNRDLLAFTFESAQDMNLFLRTTRSELNLKQVNAVCSPPTNASFDPPMDIGQLSYLGFSTYLVDTLSAPSAIVRFLCRQYGVHRIPVGDDHTYNNSEKVPANFSLFYSTKHRFSVRVSSYSGEKSCAVSEIAPARLLAHARDSDQLQPLHEALTKFRRQAEKSRTQVSEIDKKLKIVETNLNEFYTIKKTITDGIQKVKAVAAKIGLQKKKIIEIENEPALNIEQERARCRRKQRDLVLAQVAAQQEGHARARALHGAMRKAELIKVNLELKREAIVHQEGELRELKNELRNVQSTLENIEGLLNRAKSTAKEKLIEARRSTGNKMPNDADFQYKKEFNSLPADMGALVARGCELQARHDCTDEGGEQVVKEYADREKTIEKLQREVNNSAGTSKELEEKINKLSREWLPSLTALLADIDRSFGDMFAEFGSAGQVKLEKGGGDDEYDKYGISILVKFRSGEQLQQLTRHQQSGGERAVSTALYLMALQRLTTVPFRCVDEINQGMDPVNERKMFELLLKCTTDCDNAQYFLLTPKLLTNLTYNDKVVVHTIMNGKRVLDHGRWNYDTFLRAARGLGH